VCVGVHLEQRTPGQAIRDTLGKVFRVASADDRIQYSRVCRPPGRKPVHTGKASMYFTLAARAGELAWQLCCDTCSLDSVDLSFTNCCRNHGDAVN